MINNRRTICILGGTGTVGVTACKVLSKLGYSLRVSVRNIETIKDTGMYMAPNIQLFELDIDKESNVEEEVNIPSGVTIGNVMLPSVKETFEQIWPDAVKKALEILFKQNRTEKMSMAQYQIYVSKLWSEICQKVGYMNIVDYDNFGDIKSIFYDLEKRHLIKKENDGIE